MLTPRKRRGGSRPSNVATPEPASLGMRWRRIASSFAEAIAVRSGLPVEDLQVQMAGRMVADAIDVGALRSAQGDAMAVFAAWEIAGTGIANLGLQVRRRRPGKPHTLVPSKTVQEKGGQT